MARIALLERAAEHYRPARDRLVAGYRRADDRFQAASSGFAASLGRSLSGIIGRITGSVVALRDHAQRIPLVYKLSLLITVLVVTCMTLLGSLIVQQQTRLFEDQIHEQGTALARLMAQSAKEPLLATDKLALDVITTGFANNGSVKGTALITLEGQTISHAGSFHDGRHWTLRNVLYQLIRQAPASAMWEWPGTKTTSGIQVTSFVQPVVFQGVTAGYSVVTISRAGVESSLRSAKQAITGATLLIIFLGIAMAFALGKRITDPIGKLVDASHAIGKGDYSIHFKERRQDELGQLMDAFNEMAEGLLEKSQVKDALSRYLSPGVATEILANLNDVELGGKRIEGSVLFADIVGFTQIAENIRPEELVSLLNRYFTLITHACEINGGMVDKYLGDGVMLVFGAPQPHADHCFSAIACGILIQRLIDEENRLREQQGKFPIQFRIGINSGTMLAGNMGSTERMEYTVVGDTVNVASRLCGIANSGQVVVAREVYQNETITPRVLAGEYQAIRLRGISQPMTTYLVDSLTADWQDVSDHQFESISYMITGEPSHA
jgi:adenylate cyclase